MLGLAAFGVLPQTGRSGLIKRKRTNHLMLLLQTRRTETVFTLGGPEAPPRLSRPKEVYTCRLLL